MAKNNKLGLHVGQVFRVKSVAVFHPLSKEDTCVIEKINAPEGKFYVLVAIGLDEPTMVTRNTFTSDWGDAETEKVLNDLGWFKVPDKFDLKEGS